MEENRRNPKYGKEHWADSKARTQKSCYSEGGVPLRGQWTLMLITRCVGECREVAANTLCLFQEQPRTHPFALPDNLNT